MEMKPGFHIASAGAFLLMNACIDQTSERPHSISSADDTTSYTIKKTLAVSPDKVYNTYIDPQSLKQIWGVDSISVDARPEGQTRAMLNVNEQNWDFTLTYKEVIPNQKLKWVAEFDEHPRSEILTTVVFNSIKEGTEISFSQENFKTKKERDENRTANNETLNKLTSLLIKY
jgi:uncharacterized protein YndB with AHSA1/START domain